MVLQGRIELPTSSLPRTRSTTELLQRLAPVLYSFKADVKRVLNFVLVQYFNVEIHQFLRGRYSSNPVSKKSLKVTHEISFSGLNFYLLILFNDAGDYGFALKFFK